MTLRTREMRRSALVKVPSFSRNDEPGRNTCANFAVSLRNRSCTTTHSIAISAAVTCCVFGSDCAMSSPSQYRPLKLPSSAASNMFGMRRPGSASQRHAPGRLEQRARGGVRHVPVARQLVRERAHVARALHVVLAAQRVHAHAFAAEVAGGHREVGDAHHHGRALAVLGDAEAVVDRAVAGRWRTGARRRAARRAGTPVIASHRLGRVLGSRDELVPLVERLGRRSARRRTSSAIRPSVTTTCASALITATLVPGRSCRWSSALMCGDCTRSMRARVDDDQLRAFAQPPLHARGEHRVAVGRVRADHHDHVGLLDRVEGLRAGRFAERLLQAVAGGRMAHARAGVDVVVAERRAHQLLHQVGFFVGAARRGDAADRVAAVLGLDALELAGGVGDRLVPAHFLPRVGDLLADHRLA